MNKPRNKLGQFKRRTQPNIHQVGSLLAFGGFLVGTALTLIFVALGHAYPSTETIEVPAPAAQVSVLSQASEEVVTMRCQEDEIIVGTGDFHSSGLWDEYSCETLDDVCSNTWAAPEVCTLAYEAGYGDGYTDASAGASFGGDLMHPYTVQAEDTMWDLAQGVGIDLNQLLELNGGATSRDWSLIHPGEVVLFP